MALDLTPLSSLNLTTHYIPAHPDRPIPNTSPHGHPLIIYHGAYPRDSPPHLIELHLQTKSIVPQWRYTIYQTTHFHSNTHEVLCAYSGRARVLFGGEDNPEAVEVELKAGDAVVIPAGVGHRLLEDVSTYKDVGGEEFQEWEGGFLAVGGYPAGYDWDMCYGREREDDMAPAVRKVEWLKKDPLYGSEGPVLWNDEKLRKYEQRPKESESYS